MDAGQIIEQARARQIFGNPYHPYTLGLRQAFPSIKGSQGRLIAIMGYPPNRVEPAVGYRFASGVPSVCLRIVPLRRDSRSAPL